VFLGILAIGLFVWAGSARAATTNVSYGDYFFSPKVVTINLGDTVNWTPAGTDTHTLLGTGEDAICGGNLLPCSYTFTNAGTFPYECTRPFHAQLGMVGTVIVLAPPPPPVISVQPQSQSVITNSTVSFFVMSTNATAYQWQSNMVDLPGATNSLLTLDNVAVGDSGTYRVIVGNNEGSTTSSNAVLSVLIVLPPAITAQPQGQMAVTNSTVSFSVTATSAEYYQWQFNSVDLPGETNDFLTLSNVVIGDSGGYQVLITNVSGSATSSVAQLLVGYPVSFSQQPTNVNATAGTPVTLQVAAIGSPSPQYQWFLNGVLLPSQTNTTLALGAVTTNIRGNYAVVASNAFGSETSSNAALTVEPLTSIIRQKLAVITSPSGAGSVVPDLNGRSLVVAQSYAVKAIAGKGQAFANWSGIVQSDNASLSFVMPSVSNATLTANFVPSPFAAGIYSGLFWDTNDFSNDTAGYFSATVSGSGVISGQIRNAGVLSGFASTLHADGSATMPVRRRNQSPLVLTLQMDLTGLQVLTGTVSDGTSDASLVAVRAGFGASERATAYEGYYTWAMPGAPEAGPAGYSYGTARVGAAGAVHLSVFLSDGRSAVASGALSSGGQAPLYLSLYGGKGAFLSWLTFTNSSCSTNGALWFGNSALTNLFLWLGAFKPDTNGGNALDSANVSVELPDSTNFVALDPNGIGGSFTNVVLTISGTSGIFTGLFDDPISRRTIRFNGAVLRPVQTGYGFFRGQGELSDPVVIEPQ
jgi:plastocyanin